MRAAEEEQRQVIAKHGQELSIEALNDMKVHSTAVVSPATAAAIQCIETGCRKP